MSTGHGPAHGRGTTSETGLHRSSTWSLEQFADRSQTAGLHTAVLDGRFCLASGATAPYEPLPRLTEF